MYQSIYALFEAKEDTECSYVLYRSGNVRTYWVLLYKKLPWVLFSLLHTKRDTLAVEIDVENDCLDLITNLNQLGWVLHATCPGHLRDVNESLNTRLKLHEGAVVGKGNNTTTNLLVLSVSVCDVLPWVLLNLLETKGNTLTITVELEYDDTKLVTNLEHLCWVVDAAPGHIRDVKKSVETTKVYEGTVLGDVLHDTVEDCALFDILHCLALECLTLLLKESTTGENDVATTLVELDDLELEVLTKELVQVSYGSKIDLRTWKESLDADVDRQTTLYAGYDSTFNQLTSFNSNLETVPNLELDSLVFGEIKEARVGLYVFDINFNLVANADFQFAFFAYKFFCRYNAFRFVTDINQDLVLVEGYNVTHYNVTNSESLVAFIFSKQRLKVFFVNWVGVF